MVENHILIMMYAVSRTYIWNENDVLYLVLHTTVITVTQIAINSIFDSYIWYHTDINVNCMINSKMYSHTWNLNPFNSRPRHNQLSIDNYNHHHTLHHLQQHATTKEHMQEFQGCRNWLI